jgi:hypothetical protein
MTMRFFCLTLPLVALTSLGVGQGQEKGGSAPSDHHMEFCFAVVDGTTMYATRQLRVPATVQPQKAFGEFIKEHYGPPATPTCFGGPEDPVKFEASRQASLSQFRRNPKLTIIDVDWTPPSADAANPVPATSSPSR